jgi:hypothetical protein
MPLPDEDVLSTWNDGSYAELAGTSQAAPHVSGVAALLVPLGLHGQQVVKRIEDTAKPAGPGTGAGIVDAKAAVAGLARPGATASSPGPGSVHASASVKSVQRIRAVLRNGVRVRCAAAANGRCATRIRARGTTIVTGSAAVESGHTVLFSARVTHVGRKLLKHARKLSASAQISVPGGSKVVRRLRFKR